MIPQKMLEVLKYEGVVSIVSQGVATPHAVNTWNSYIKITKDERLLIPVGGMNTTEGYVKKNNNVLLTLGSREVEGFHSMGTGFLIKGTASFIYEGSEHDTIKEKFPWARATLEVKPESITQTL